MRRGPNGRARNARPRDRKRPGSGSPAWARRTRAPRAGHRPPRRRGSRRGRRGGRRLVSCRCRKGTENEATAGDPDVGCSRAARPGSLRPSSIRRSRSSARSLSAKLLRPNCFENLAQQRAPERGRALLQREWRALRVAVHTRRPRRATRTPRRPGCHAHRAESGANLRPRPPSRAIPRDARSEDLCRRARGRLARRGQRGA
jgi:hypothetical protein